MIQYCVQAGTVNRIFDRFQNVTHQLQIGSVSIDIDTDRAEKIVVESLPEDQLVWHINPKKGEIFYNENYPELSLVPHPSSWVAGNIYYSSKKTATLALRQYIQSEMNKLTRNTQAQLNVMGVLRDSLDQ